MIVRVVAVRVVGMTIRQAQFRQRWVAVACQHLTWT